MWPIDFTTLVLIVAAGIELGTVGILGFSIFGWLLGSWKLMAYDAAGMAALWQLSRQKFL